RAAKSQPQAAGVSESPLHNKETAAAPDSRADKANKARKNPITGIVVDELPSGFLVRWMFGFLWPVKWIVFFNCLWISTWVGSEALTTKQTARVVNTIQSSLHAGARVDHFWHWLIPTDFRWSHVFGGLFGREVDFRYQVIGLLIIVLAYIFFRYLRVVSATKMSMNMVYYIREAVYDKLQRVGFGFHDAVSSGQLINRALSDLQNVRAFVETVVNQSLEIGLTVGAYVVLLVTISPWIALLSLLPLPLWTFYILRFSKHVQPAAKAVMESEDKN